MNHNLDKNIQKLQSKVSVQRNEIARLTVACDELEFRLRREAHGAERSNDQRFTMDER